MGSRILCWESIGGGRLLDSIPETCRCLVFQKERGVKLFSFFFSILIYLLGQGDWDWGPTERSVQLISPNVQKSIQNELDSASHALSPPSGAGDFRSSSRLSPNVLFSIEAGWYSVPLFGGAAPAVVPDSGVSAR